MQTKPESTSAPLDTASQPSVRFERKFFVLPHGIGLAHAFLRQICRPDKAYPEGLIHTLYFDTPELEQYERSSSGDFRKDKVRIRWYDNPEACGEAVPVYLELKTREGFVSSKLRRRFSVPAYKLQTANLAGGIIEGNALLETLASFGHSPEAPLRPVIVVSYQRYRFNEILTGMRVSLDFFIRSTVVTGGLGSGEQNLELRGGIVEIKGQTFELPPTLRRMKMLDTSWGRFSKYSQSIEAHLEQPGMISRLWPSGRTPHR